MDRSAGGLATAIGPLMSKTRGIWIGWPGDQPPEPDPRREEHLRRWSERYGYTPLDLPPSIARRFYEGYANQILWPLFHQLPLNLEFELENWEAYVEANRRFCEAVLQHLRPNDLVWIHDYHLMLLPRLLRDSAPLAAIGFFLHIPFPASEMFRIIPRRDELLQGLLGADLLAFQTHGHLQHFRESLLRILGIDSGLDRVQVGGRSTRLAALPIGIAPQEFSRHLDDNNDTQKALAQHRERFKNKAVIVAVDRMDYTKGLPHRIRTFRRLLKRAPQLKGKVVLVQVAVPSRERIPHYEQLRHQVSEMVGELNGEFGTPDWTPIVYMRRGIPRAELVALYAASDVGWVTPLRDGMNLVAKEYVACHRDGQGILVLSEFAGAAEEMGEAFLVNPYDEDRTAAVLERVLNLPQDERRQRMTALYRRVQRNNVFAWGERFISDLRKAAGGRRHRRTEEPQDLSIEGVLEAFRTSSSRLLILDYDGTLVPLARTPSAAAPTAAVTGLLRRLTGMERTTVAVVSGRPRRDLEAWFGDIEGLFLVAEHGALLRQPSNRSWETLRPTMPVDWKKRVLPVLEHFTDRTPGSFIEEKEYALVWHNRIGEPEFGEWLANELVATLEAMLASTEARAIFTKKSVEVRLSWANKGEAAGRIEALRPGATFRLAVGDDRTDEELFERMPRDAWTIHVGEGRSRARFRLMDPSEVRALLQRLVDSSEPRGRESSIEDRSTLPEQDPGPLKVSRSPHGPAA